jgi:altered-inheritance-of-mitochondria protein 5
MARITNPTISFQAGGVTLTLSITYLALATHTRNRQAQSAVLRAQASTLDALVPPDPSVPLFARRRNATVLLPDGTYRPRESLREQDYHHSRVRGGPVASFVETAKTKWNNEVLSAVHWAQSKDWGAVREEAEEGVARLLGVELSREPVPVRETAPLAPPTPRAPESSPAELEARRQDAAAAAHRVGEALQQARDKAVVVAQAMRDEAKQIVSEAREAAARGVERAEEAASRGREKAHELAERTKAAVYLAEEKAETKMDAKLLRVSDVEKALAERYDSARREERMKRSVEEVLRERYIPIDKRDNSQLRLV